RSSDFRTYTRSLSLEQPTDVTAVLWQAALELFERRVPMAVFPVRLLGVGAARLVRDTSLQGDLFDDGWRTRPSALDQAVDKIRARYGADATGRGGVQESSGERCPRDSAELPPPHACGEGGGGEGHSCRASPPPPLWGR